MVSRRMRSVHIGSVVVLLLALLPTWVAAQVTGTIRGRVVDAANNRPLPNAEVTIVGTSRVTPTDAAGNFLLLNVPVGTHTMRVTIIGYAPREQQVTVTAGQSVSVSFAMQISAIALDEIVVTGTGGATSKRTIGNSITKVDAATVAQRTAITTVTELLQAKSPGLQILPNSGTLGAAADMRIRGAGSLTNTTPVVFIDGVRFSTDDLGTFTPSGAGTTSYTGQAFNAFDFINPNDIESIEVIKGPAAATLYGAEAANGVIQIITKKGRRGDQPMRWDVRMETGFNEWGVPIPDNLTTCTQAMIDERDSAGNIMWPGCQGLEPGTIIRGNPLRDDPAALRRGVLQRVSVSARGGGEHYQYYFAGSVDEENGIFYNNYNDKRSVRANFTIRPNEWLDVFVSAAYARANLRVPVGDEAAQGMLLSAFGGRPGQYKANPLNEGWLTTRAEQANAYNNTTRSDRLTLGGTVTVAPFRWWSNRLTVGYDFTASLAQVISPPGSVDADYAGVLSGGLVAQRVPRNYVTTLDYLGKVEHPVTPDLVSTTTYGMQAVARKYETIGATGYGLGAPDITLISRAATTLGTNSYSEQKSLGFYLQEQLGWKNRLFVTGALRADDNSSFGTSFDWIYYPKAQLAWVLSEEPLFGDMLSSLRIDNLKLRTAYGGAGQAPAPFSATQTYTVDKFVDGNGNVGSALRVSALGNPDLKAEHGTEFEAGFDAGLLGDRLAVELTYYHKRMKDVIVSVAAPASSGFAGTFFGGGSSIMRNLGETLNTGLEVTLTGTPFQTQRFGWDMFLSVATNSNKLVDFGDERTDMAVSGASYSPNLQRHRKGYPLAGYWTYRLLRNPDGSPVIYTHTNGVNYLVVSDTLEYHGQPTPKREISLGNTFTLFRDFRVFVLFDYKGGHHLYNYKSYVRCVSRLNCEERNLPKYLNSPDSIIYRSNNSVRQSDAAANRNTNAGNPYSPWIEKADFIKLRDVSLQYTLPPELAQKLRASAASITLAGHNLALFSDYRGLDPEVNGYGNRQFVRADVYAVPMMRRWSMSMNLSF